MIILDYNTKETVGELWQYDYGETLRIQGGNLQKVQEVHFSLSRTGGDSVTRIGVTKDDATDVVIPDSMLENNDSEIDYLIYVFLYNRDSASGETTKRFALSVQSRPKPEHSGGEDGNIFGQVIEEVRKSAESAEMAKKKAAEYAEQTKEDAQNTAEDRKEVERLVDSVKDIDEQVETIKTYKEQAQTSATNALLSEQNTKKAEQSALQARAGAETAENSAEQHATQVRGDKAEVERLSTQVREDKASVEQTTQDFDLKAQQTLADVNNAGQTQTERVQSAGTTALENIQIAQNTAIKAVETAKTEAVNTVQTEGEKQVQAVQGVAQEIVADREQIAKNKTDIAELRHTKANAIVENASGTLINIKDSAEQKLQDLKVFGKSTQDGEPTLDAPQEIKSIGKYNEETKKYEIAVQVTGKNLCSINTIESASKKVTSENVMFNGKELYVQGEFRADEVSESDIIISVFYLDESKEIIGGNGFASKLYKSFKEISCKFNGKGANAGQDVDLTKVKHIYLTFEYKVDGVLKPFSARSIIASSESVKSGEFAPYNKQEITVQIPDPLRGIGEYKDVVTKDCITRKIRKILLNGSEDWYMHNADYNIKTNRFYTGLENVLHGYGTGRSLCNKLKPSRIDEDEEGQTADGYTLYVKIEKEKARNVEEFKQWLLENPLTVLYVLDEPVIEELPEEVKQQLSALQTYYPTTIVMNDANAEMEVTYVADTKNYIDNKLKELVTANMQNTANLLSLMPISVQAEMIENDTNRILEEVTQ